MKKSKHSYEEILADLIFMLEQSYVIEHKQDYEGIRKYGVSQ